MRCGGCHSLFLLESMGIPCCQHCILHQRLHAVLNGRLIGGAGTPILGVPSKTRGWSLMSFPLSYFTSMPSPSSTFANPLFLSLLFRRRTNKVSSLQIVRNSQSPVVPISSCGSHCVLLGRIELALYRPHCLPTNSTP